MENINFPGALRQIGNGFIEQSIAAMLGAADDEEEKQADDN